jgi:1,4-dihydroxy-6-naphthoate synthase
MTRKISLAYSPDTDDAFMVYAIQHKLINLRGFEFHLESLDIQVLNHAALSATYDITAISMAAYPEIRNTYFLMPVGSSIGDQFGPAIVVRKSSEITSVPMLAGRKIATPGSQTSAFYAGKSVLPDFTPIHLSFSEIENAVVNGTADAGILIHEPQLLEEFQDLRKIADLGTLWHQQCGLPLPLGGNAIRRSLGPEAIAELTAIYKESIEYALAHRMETIAKASAAAIAGLPLNLADKYIDQYVNHRSLRLDDDVRQGLDALFAAGHAAGLCQPLACSEFIC